MASSRATTVPQFLDELPADRRPDAVKVVAMVRKHLPKGFTEMMCYGMPMWGIPLSAYPDTYNGQPIGVVAFAAQKQHFSLYLMPDDAAASALKAAYAKAGKRFDMGKSCLRFKRWDDLVPDAVATVIGLVTPAELIAHHERVHGAGRKPGESKRAASTAVKAKPAAKTTKAAPRKKAASKSPAKKTVGKKAATAAGRRGARSAAPAPRRSGR